MRVYWIIQRFDAAGADEPDVFVKKVAGWTFEPDEARGFETRAAANKYMAKYHPKLAFRLVQHKTGK